jgi:hypothetical protein
MSYVLRPATPADLPELSRFLTEGFHTGSDASFAAPEVLSWKFFDAQGGDTGESPRSYVACDSETGRIVGHLGLCPGRFRGAGLPTGGVSTQHIIDWVTSGPGRGAGASLMRRAHASAATQYSVAMSAEARAVGQRAGYDLVAMVPVMQRVIRVGFRLREPAHGPIGRVLRAARDLARRGLRPPRPPRLAVDLRPVQVFGPEIDPILEAYQSRAIYFSRGAAMLNHLLRYPRGGVSGWHLQRDGALVGFAILTLVDRPGPVREGRIAGCMLEADDPDLWHAAIDALTAELARQGADLVVAMASTGWTEQALRASGYVPVYSRDFRLRDRSGAVARSLPFHLTFLEADAAYT